MNNIKSIPLLDPTLNVRELIEGSVKRQDDLRAAEIRRIEERILAVDDKNQMQFIAQEKAVAAALEGTKEAIVKADATTDKRFDLLSEKIDGVMSVINKTSGERGIYVTHTDLNIAMDKLQTSIEATLRPVVAFMNSNQGQQQGSNESLGRLIAIIGATGVVVGIIARFAMK